MLLLNYIIFFLYFSASKLKLWLFYIDDMMNTFKYLYVYAVNDESCNFTVIADLDKPQNFSH